MSTIKVSYEDFSARQNTALHDIQAVALLSFSNHRLPSFLLDALHGIQDDA